jgi:hypothetical protein
MEWSTLVVHRAVGRLAGSAIIIAIVILASVAVYSFMGAFESGTKISSASSTSSAATSFSGWKYSVTGSASGVALTPDGAYLAVGTQSSYLNGSVYLFEGKSGSYPDSGPIILWQRHLQTSILFVAISRDGSLIAASGSQLVGRALAYTNNRVYVLSRDGAVLWNSTVPDSAGPAGPMVLSPDDSRLVVREQDTVVCYNATSGSIIWRQEIGGAAVYALSTNGDASVLGAGGGGKAYLLSMADGHQLWSQPVLDGYAVGPVTVSADGAYVAVGSVKSGSDGSVSLMDGKTGDVLWTHHVDSDVLSASLSFNGSRIAFGTNDWIFLCDRSGAILWNDTAGKEGVLVVSKPSRSVGSDVFAGVPTVMLINGSSGKAEWTAEVGHVNQIGVDQNASLAAVAAGPPDSGPFLPSGGTVYLFPLNKGIN